MRRNGFGRIAAIIAAVLLICTAALLCFIHFSGTGKGAKDGKEKKIASTEDRIDDIIHSHDKEDWYAGVGGRSDTEAEIDYIILRHMTGLEEPKIIDPDDLDDEDDDGDKDKDTGDDDGDKDTGDDDGDKDTGDDDGDKDTGDDDGDKDTGDDDGDKDTGDDDGDKDTGDDDGDKELDPEADWREFIYQALKDSEPDVRFAVPKDVTEQEVLDAIWVTCRYRTGEDGIFMNQISYNYENESIDNGITWHVTFVYEREKDEINRIKKDTSEKEDVEVGNLKYSGLSDIEKVELINQFICDYADYYPTEPYPDQSHNAYGALFEKYCVCDGFSRLTKMMCDDMGVECHIITGKCLEGGGHAWNVVKVDGKWYHLDVTWNDGCGDRYQYFLVPDSFMERSRTWNKDLCPKVTTAPYYR